MLLSPSSAVPRHRSLEEELELRHTRVALELADTVEPVPVGRKQRFLVKARLGAGGMGTVYLAHDRDLGRDVALKMVGHRLDRARLEDRLRHEARVLASLDHEHVVPVHDIDTTEAGELFVALKHVEGPNLREWQRRRRIGEPADLDELIDVYLQVGRGLLAAHERGVIHRDLKPDNVLVEERSGRPRALVSDFGLADYEGEADETDTTVGDDAPAAVMRARQGTLAYMAPEQLRREPADARSDQHQYCVALWEALAGIRPFPDDGRTSLTPSVLPPRPSAMPRWVHRVLVRGLAFERRDRFVNMASFLAALERARRRQRVRPWIIRGVVAMSVLAGVIRAVFPDPCAHAADTVAEIWTPDARQAVDATLRGHPDAFADHVATYVVTGLDEAAANWTTRTEQACEALTSTTTPDPALERRVVCLQRWAERMRRRVERLRSADPRLMDRAHELVAPMLEQGDECRVPPMLIDAEVQTALEDSEDAERLGRRDDALTLANAALALARDRGAACQPSLPDGSVPPYSHELAAAHERLGHAYRSLGRGQEALEQLAMAHVHAVGCGDDQRALDARLFEAKVRAVDLDDVLGAARALEEARARAGLLSEHALGPRRPELWKAEGLVAAHAGDYDTARQHYERGLAALGDPRAHPIAAAKLIGNIGVTFHEQKRYAEAADAYERGFALVEARLGPDHPETRERAARRALNLGLLALAEARHDDARARFAEVTAAGRPELAIPAQVAWARSEHAQGSLEQATLLARELVGLIAAHPQLPRRILATARATAGQILAESGDANGVALLSQAVDAFVAEGDHDATQRARYLLARGLHELGDDAGARRRLTDLQQAPPTPDALLEHVAALEEALAATPTSPSPPRSIP